MAKMTIQTVLERIRIAPNDSPLLILTCREKDNVLCYFANTVTSQQFIRAKPSSLIGVFDGSMDLEEIKKQMKNQMRMDYVTSNQL